MAAIWTVKNVKPLNEYKLLLTFEHGIKKKIRHEAILEISYV